MQGHPLLLADLAEPFTQPPGVRLHLTGVPSGHRVAVRRRHAITSRLGERVSTHKERFSLDTTSTAHQQLRRPVQRMLPTRRYGAFETLDPPRPRGCAQRTARFDRVTSRKLSPLRIDGRNAPEQAGRRDELSLDLSGRVRHRVRSWPGLLQIGQTRATWTSYGGFAVVGWKRPERRCFAFIYVWTASSRANVLCPGRGCGIVG